MYTRLHGASCFLAWFFNTDRKEYRETRSLFFFIPGDSRLSVGIAGRLFFLSGCLQRVRLRAGWWDTRAESSFVLMLNKGGRRKKYINSHPASRFFRGPVAHPCPSLSPSLSLFLSPLFPRCEFCCHEQPLCGKIYP